MNDMKVRLSTMWIFAMLNYLYADVLGMYDPVVLNDLMAGQAGDMQITDGFLLGAAVLMETAIMMVILSRALPYKTNRWANIITGIIHTTAVSASMFVGTPASYYIFFGTIEIACTLLIIWLAAKWPNPETSNNSITVGQLELEAK